MEFNPNDPKWKAIQQYDNQFIKSGTVDSPLIPSVDPNQFEIKGDTDFAKYIPETRGALTASGVLEQRAQNQGTAEKWGRGLARFGGSVFTKFMTGVGYAGGAVAGGASRLTGSSFEESMDWFLNNQWVNAFQSAEESLKGSMEIYKTRAYTDGDFWDKISTSEFWTDDFMDGLAFAVSAMVPGGIAKSAGVIGTGSNMIGRGISKAAKKVFSKSLGQAAGSTARGVAQGSAKAGIFGEVAVSRAADMAGLTAYATLTEAGFEGKDVYDHLIAEGIDESTAAKAAYNTVKANAVALIASNLFEQRMIFGNYNRTSRAIKRAYKNGGLTPEGLAAATPNKFKKVLKNAGKGAALEGLWEENVQHSIQKIMMEFAENDPDKLDSMSDWAGEVLQDTASNWGDTDKQTAMFLGAVLGIGFGIGGGLREAKGETAALNNIAKSLKISDTLVKGNLSVLYETENITDEDGKVTGVRFKRDEKGQLIPNVKEMHKLMFDTMMDKSLYDEALAEAAAGNHLNSELLHEIIFARHVFPILSDPNYSQEEALAILEGKFEGQFAQEKLGLEETITDEAELADELKLLEDIYSKRKDRLSAYAKLMSGLNGRMISDKYGEELGSRIKKAAYLEGVKQLFLEDLMRANEGRAEDASGISQLDQELYDKINVKNEELQKLLDDSYKLFDKLASTPIEDLQKELGIEDFNEIQAEIDNLEAEIAETEDADEAVKLGSRVEFLKNKKAYLENEQASINGVRRDLFNDVMSAKNTYLDIADEEFMRADRSNVPGYLDQHYYNKAINYMSDQRVRQMIESYKRHEITIDDLAAMLLDEKNLYRVRPQTMQELEGVKEALEMRKQLLENGMQRAQQRIDEENAKVEYIELDDGSIYPDKTGNPAPWQEQYDALESKLAKVQAAEDKLVTELDNRVLEDAAKDKEFDEMYADPARKAARETLAEETATVVHDTVHNQYLASPETFSNISRTAQAIRDLKNLRDIFLDRKDIGEVNEALIGLINQYIENLEEAMEVAIKNQGNRKAEQQQSADDNASQLYSAIGIDILNDTTNENSQALRQAVGAEFFDRILEAAKNDQDYRYNPIYAYILLHKAKGNKAFTDDIKARMDSIEEAVTFKIPSQYKKAFQVAPLRSFKAGVRHNFNIRQMYKEENYDKNHPLSKVERTNNIPEFLRDLRTYPEDKLFLNGTTREDLISQVELFNRMMGLLAVNTITRSDFSIAESLSSEMSAYQSFKKAAGNGVINAPNIQQDIALRQLQIFFNRKDSNRALGNAAYLRGPAGTGKTFIVARWLPEILGLKNEEVFGVAHRKESAANIASSLGQSTNRIATNLKAEDLNGKKLLIVDEVGGLTHNDIKHISDLTKGKGIKVVFLGDPNQIVTEMFTPIEVGGNVENVIDISPLTSVYRSDVNAITSISDLYQDNRRTVVPQVLEATLPLGQKGAKGMHAVKTSVEMRAAIQAMADTNSAIIVDTEAKKNVYQQQYPDIKVLTYKEAQGFTFNSVFLDVENTDQFDSQLHYNRAMYTGISRAVNYVAVMHTEHSNNTNPAIDQAAETQANERVENETRYREQKVLDHAIVSEYLDGVKPMPKPTQTTEEEETTEEEVPSVIVTEDEEVPVTESTEEDDEDAQDNDGGNTPPPVTPIVPSKGNFIHSPDHPSSDKFHENGVKKGDRVYYVTSMVNHMGKDVQVVYVVSPVGEELDGVNEYTVVAMLSEKEIAEHEIGKHFKASTKPNIRIVNNRLRLTKAEVERHAFASGIVQRATGPKYIYDSAKRRMSDVYTQILDLFKDRFKPTKGTKYEVIVATRDDVDNAKKAGAYLKPGRPYIKATQPNSDKPQYLRLTPRKLRKTDSEVQHLLNFIEQVKIIEAGSGVRFRTQEFYDLMEEFKSQFTIEDYKIKLSAAAEVGGLTEEVSNAFRALVPMVYGVGSRNVEIDINQEEVPEGFTSQKKPGTTNIHYVMKDMGNGKFHHKKEFFMSRGKGSAQIALNKLARANSYVESRFSTDPNPNYVGDPAYDIAFFTRDKISKVRKSTGKLLVPNLDAAQENIDNLFYAELKDAYNELVPEGGEKLGFIQDEAKAQEVIDILVKNGVDINDINAAREDISTSRNTGIDLQALDNLLQFDENGEHGLNDKYLRKPILTTDVKQGNRTDAEYANDMNDLFTSPLHEIEGSKLTIEVDNTAVSNTQEEPQDDNDDDWDDDDLLGGPVTRNLKEDSTADLGDVITLKEARSLARQLGIPESDLKFVDAAAMAALQLPTEKLRGVMIDGVAYVKSINNGNSVYEGVVKHELFHILYNYFLDAKTRESMLRAASKEIEGFDNMSSIDKEEAITERFQEYVAGVSKPRPVLRKVFNFFMDLFRFLTRQQKSLDSFFKDFYHNVGVMPVSGNPKFKSRRTLTEMRRLFYTSSKYRASTDALYDLFHDIYNNEKTPMTFSEIKKTMYKRLQNDAFLENVKERYPYHAEAFDFLLKPTPEGKHQFKPRFDMIFEDLFPGSSELKTAFEDYTSNEEEQVELEMANLNDEIVDNQTVNPETRQSQSVKLFFYSIRRPKELIGVQSRQLFARSMYVTALRMFRGSSLRNGVNIDLVEKRSRDFGARGKDFMDALFKLADKASYIPVEENATKFANINTFQFNNGEKIVKINRGGKITRVFINDIVEQTGLSRKEVVTLFKAEQARNMWVEVTSHFSSHAESNFHIVDRRKTIKTNDGVARGRFVSLTQKSPLSVTNAIRENFAQSLYNTFPNVEVVKEMEDQLVSIGDRLESHDDAVRIEAFISFLQMINFDHNSDFINDVAPSRRVTDDIAFLLKARFDVIYKSKGKNAEIKGDQQELDDLEGTEEELTVQDIIERDFNSGLRKIANYFNQQRADERSTTVTDVKGNRRYLYYLSNFMVDTINNLVYQTGKGNRPNHLNSSFYQENIFLNNGNKVHNLVNYGGIEVENGNSVLYHREKDQDWYERSFIASFINRTGQAAGDYYVQWFYTLSNRTNIIGARINRLNERQIREGLASMLRQTTLRSGKLEGYIKNFKVTSNTNMTIFSEEDIAEYHSNPSEENLARLVDNAYNELEVRAEEFAQEVVDRQIEFPTGFKAAEGTITKKGDQYNLTAEDIKTEAFEYFANNYVNGYFLNQLTTGEFAAFKGGLDIVKRLQGASSPGVKPDVSDMGTDHSYKLAVVQGREHGTSVIRDMLESVMSKEDADSIIAKFPKDFESTDAQGFMLPSRQESLKRGFGTNYQVGNILKPSHYEVVVREIEGEQVVFPVMVKYSSIVLTDDLISKHPKLAKIRKMMELNKIDELVYDSAVKVGVPIKGGQVTADQILDETFAFPEDHIHTLSNANYRLQFNPSSKVDKTVAVPSQLMYFLSAFTESEELRELTDDIYTAVSDLIDFKMDRFKAKELKSAIKSAMGKSDSSAREGELVNLAGGGVSFDLPAISSKVFNQLSSLVSDASVSIRIKGSKLILQSEEGITHPSGRALGYGKDPVTGMMYAEVVLPKEISGMVKVGDFVTPDVLGFRIPSSELHSAVPMKVVDFYSNKENNNIIVAPKELVVLHGSDFDVDSLFVLRREYMGNNSQPVLSGFESGDPVGYIKNNDGKYVLNPNFLADIDQRLEAEDITTSEYNRLREAYYKNKIVEGLLTVTSHPDNIRRMMSPISMERAAAIVKAKKDAMRDLDLSDVRDNFTAFRSNIDGLTLTGIFANSMKALAYMVRSSSEGKTADVAIRNEENYLRYSKSGEEVINRTLSEKEEGTGNSVWDTLDSLLNAAIDNVKEQILPFMNITSETVNGAIAMLVTGVQLDDLYTIMDNDVMREVSRLGSRRASEIKTKLEGLAPKRTDENAEEVIDVPVLNLDDVKALPQNLKDFSPENALTGLAILEFYQKAEVLGDNMVNFAKALGIIRSMPGSVVNSNSTLEAWNKVFDNEGKLREGFKFDIGSFFEANPHLKSAHQAFMYLREKGADIFFRNSPEVEEFVNNFSSVKIKDGRVEDEDADQQEEIEATKKADSLRLQDPGVDKHTSRENIKDFLMQYLISRTKYVTEVSNSVRKQPGRRTITGPEAWSNNFAEKLQKYITTDSNNPFLNRLIIRSRGGRKSIAFDGISLEPVDIMELESAFDAIKSEEIKQGLVRYAVINYGVDFGFNNYSLVIPSNRIKEVDNAYRQVLNKMSPRELNRLKEHFELYTAIGNGTKLPYLSKNYKLLDKSPGIYRQNGETIQYSFIVQSESVPPLYVKRGFKNENVYVRTSSLDGKHFYSYVSYARLRPVYDIPSSVIDNGYKVSDYFNGEVYAKVNDINTSRVFKDFVEHKVGDELWIAARYDRTDRKRVVITEVIPSTDDRGFATPHSTYRFDYTQAPKDKDYSVSEYTETPIRSVNFQGKKNLDVYVETNFTAAQKEVYDAIKSLVSDDISIEFGVKFSSDTRMGLYDSKTRTIQLSSQAGAETLLHEILHDALMGSINEYTNMGNNLNDEQRAALDLLNQEYEKFLEKGQYYASHNLHEFISEVFSNPVINRQVIKQRTLWQRIIDTIRTLFGLPKSKEPMLKALMTLGANPKIDVTDHSQMAKEVNKGKIADDIAKSIIDNSKSLKVDETGKQRGYLNEGKKYDSVTTSIYRDFVRRPYDADKSVAEKVADRYFPEGIDPEQEISTDKGIITRQEYIDKFEFDAERSRRKGSIIHKILEMRFARGADQTKLGREIANLIQSIGHKPNYYDWVHENAPEILKLHGVDISLDEMLPEVKIFNSELGLAGTADAVVKHDNGKFSVIDYKTGEGFVREMFNNLLKYGDQTRDITDNERNRAKLQVMMYAVMLKIQHPEMEFQNLKVAWIPNEWDALTPDVKSNVEVSDFLRMIESYIAEKNPEYFAKLSKERPEVFEATTYNASPRDIGTEMSETGKSGAQLLDIKRKKLKYLTNKSAMGTNLSPTQKEEVIKLTQEIAALSKDHSVILSDYSEDMSIAKRWMGIYGDTKNPYLQTYGKILRQAKDNVNRRYDEKKRKFDRLLLPVLEEWGKKGYVGNRLNNIVYWKEDGTGLYNFAYTTRVINGIEKQVLITKENHPKEWAALTTAQKNLLSFINKEYAAFFAKDGLMNQPATITNTDKTLTNLDLVKRTRPGWTYHEGFFPKVPQSAVEIRQRNKLDFNRAKQWALKNFTNFLETNFDEYSNQYEALPVKYLGSPHIEAEKNYSMNLEGQFDKFMRNMYIKEELDEVHAIGRGLQTWFENQGDMKNSIAFLEDHINLDILNRKIEPKLTSKEIRITRKSKDKEGDFDYVFSAHNFVRWMKSAVSAPIMWWQPINGTRNKIFINIINIKKSLADSASQKLAGVSESITDFTFKDLQAAEKEWLTMQGDFIQGNGHSNKMWLMARKFKYLPNNYDWASNKKELLGEAKDFWDLTLSSESVYAFHTVPEEWTAMVIMAAQMKHMKHNGKSMWDHYEVQTIEGVPELVWTGGVRGTVVEGDGEVTRELTELDSNEVGRLKRIYQMMHGGYRREERTALEAYVFGQVFLQFRKYLPSILMNAMRSKTNDLSLGYYQKRVKDGEETMEWVGQMIESRWLLAGKGILRAVRLSRNTDYSFSNMTDTQKKDFMDALMTGAFWITMYAGYVAAFSDVDDDDQFKKMSKLIIDNFSQQYNPWDIGRNLLTTGAVPNKAYKTSVAFSELVWSAAWAANEDSYTQDGRLKGATETIKSIPGLSSIYNWQRFFKDNADFDWRLYR